MKTPTDEQLMAEHLNHRPDAFELLVRRHSAELYRFVYRFTNSSVAAEDVAQEAFAQAYLSADKFDPSRKFRPWLFTIAANKARDWLRKRSRRSEVALDARIDGGDESGRTYADLLADSPDDSLPEIELEEQRKVVRRIVDAMPEFLREVLILAYYHRMPYREIAEVLDVPVGTVKSRLHSAVGHFGTAYREMIDFEQEAIESRRAKVEWD